MSSRFAPPGRTGMLAARIVAGLAIGAVLALSGCQSASNNAPESAGATAAPVNEGSVSLSLTLGGGYRLSSVAYDVSGNGFHKVGTVDAAGSSVLSTVIGGIPFGSGYTLQLTARDVANQLTPCVGSAPFDIVSAGTVAVPVHLTCHDMPSTSPPPPSVPVPGWARYPLAALLLGLGSSFVRRRDRAVRG